MNHLCGIRLSTVGVVVGWVNFIGAIFSSILLIVAFTRLDEVVKMIEEQMNDANNQSSLRTAKFWLQFYKAYYLLYTPIILFFFKTWDANQNIPQMFFFNQILYGLSLFWDSAVIIALCVYLTVSLANVFASAMLIVGTVKERHLLMTPWLINAYIFIFFNVLNFIYMVYMAIATSAPIGSVILAIITTGISLVIQCTIWNAIYSLFQQIRANRDLQQRLLPTTSNTSYTNYTKMPPTSY